MKRLSRPGGQDEGIVFCAPGKKRETHLSHQSKTHLYMSKNTGVGPTSEPPTQFLDRTVASAPILIQRHSIQPSVGLGLRIQYYLDLLISNLVAKKC
eukprot:scaffold7349_cov173-Amphora_coffeaeformis.AAC.38